ncbi:MAG: hypothetical protein MR762_15210 [Clostridiales bacterium]|nr:hypothetical protein [Clostridiales bacterium]
MSLRFVHGSSRSLFAQKTIPLRAFSVLLALPECLAFPSLRPLFFLKYSSVLVIALSTFKTLRQGAWFHFSKYFLKGKSDIL